MIRGGDFYAIWIEERGLWSTDEQDALQLIDLELENYAKENSVSLSKLIENYLNSLTKKQEKEIKVSPLVESLTGIIPTQTEKKNDDEYYEYLNKKYS